MSGRYHSLRYSLFSLILLMIFCAVARAQSDPEKDAWRYVQEDPAMVTARVAEARLPKLFEKLPPLEQQALMKEEDLSERIKVALRLSGDHLSLVKQTIANRNNRYQPELARYRNLIDYARCLLDLIVETKQNSREYRTLCKNIELMLRQQLEILGDFQHDQDGPSADLLNATVLAVGQYRIEILNRVFGRVIVAPPQQIGSN